MNRTTAPRSNQTLLLKLTPGVTTEAKALCSRASRRATLGPNSAPSRAARRDLLVIRDSRRPDQIRIGRRRSYDLSAEAGRREFVAQLGLDGQKRRSVRSALAAAPPDGRDELAQLCRVLRWSEAGTIDLRRVVLSGHYSANNGIRGNQASAGDQRPHNGALPLQLLARVVSAFPVAARKIEHLMLAACFLAPAGDRAGRRTLAGYRRIFHGLKSVTGYAGKAPASSNGAARDLHRWARATRAGEAPSRDAVFGRCRVGVTEPSLLRKRNGGVVITPEGTQGCR